MPFEKLFLGGPHVASPSVSKNKAYFLQSNTTFTLNLQQLVPQIQIQILLICLESNSTVTVLIQPSNISSISHTGLMRLT